MSHPNSTGGSSQEPTLSGRTQPGIWGGTRLMRSPYLHIEIEAPAGFNPTEQTDFLLLLQERITELIGDFTVITNKVRNQYPAARWRRMTPEQRQRILDQIDPVTL